MKRLILTIFLIGLFKIEYSLSHKDHESLNNQVKALKTFVLNNEDGYDKLPNDSQIENYERITIQNYTRPVLKKMPEIYKHLKVLSITHSKFSAIEDEAFKHMDKLEELYLSMNENFAKVNHKTFIGLNNLKKLCLGMNDIRNIEKKSFEPLEDLEKLSISHNEYIAFDDLKANFVYLKKIKHLNLNCIKFDSEYFDIFKPISKNLEILELKSNRISDMPDHKPFKDFHNLKSLYLNNSTISTFHPKCFEDLDNLELLDLSHNKLVSIEDGAFIGLDNLQYLDLSNNSLIELNEKEFDWDKLKSLNLEDNKWICSCKLKWMASRKEHYFKDLSCTYGNNTESLIEVVKKLDCNSGFPPAAIAIIIILIIAFVGAIALFIHRRSKKTKLLGKSAEYSQVYNKTTAPLA